jgi:hypothetical protein
MFIPLGYLAQAEILLMSDCGLRNAELIGAALNEAETRARRGPMPLFLADAYLLRAQLALSVAKAADRRLDIPVRPSGTATGPDKNVRPTAKEYRDQAAELIRKHGYGRREPDLAVLNCEIDPCLENFQTACAKVVAEGWWHLMPRLEALAAAQRKGFLGTGPRKHWNDLLEPLREAEKAYHAERDAYLRKVEEG